MKKLTAIALCVAMLLTMTVSVLVTGAVDYVTDGARVAALGNGHPLMTRVTGVGCAMGALAAACVASACALPACCPPSSARKQ